MTGDRADGSRKGMRAIPLTQRQRKLIKPDDSSPRLTDTSSPRTSSHKRRAPKIRRRAATPSATVTPAGAGVAPAPISRTRPARQTAPQPASSAAPSASLSATPARAPRRTAVQMDTPTQPVEGSAPRRTQRRPPPSVTPVSPLDLVDTAPLIAPASLRPAPPAAEPELAETTRLKLPRGRSASGSASAVDTVDTAPLGLPIDAVDTTQLAPIGAAIETVDTTPLSPFSAVAPAIDAVDTTQLAPIAPATPATPAVETVDTTPLALFGPPEPGMAVTARLNSPRALARPAHPAPPAISEIMTTPLGLIAPATTPVDAVDTTQLTPPIDAVDTTQLAPPVDQVDTTQLVSPVEMVDTTQLAPSGAARVAPPYTPGGGPGSSPSSPSDPGSPRRVKVRVRRKRASGLGEDSDPAQMAIISPTSAPASVTDQETAFLPPLRQESPAPQAQPSSLTLNIISGSETAQFVSAQPPAVDLPPTTPLISLAANVTPVAETPATEAPVASAQAVIIETPPDETPMMDAPIAGATSAADADTAPLAAKAAAADQAPAAPDTTPARESAPTPTPVVTTRKLPTLAVMAALASRAEARADAEAREERQSRQDRQDAEKAASDPQGAGALADEDTDKLRVPASPIISTPSDGANASRPSPALWPDEAPPSPAVPAPTQDAALVSDLRALMTSATPTRPGGAQPGARTPSQPSTTPATSATSGLEEDGEALASPPAGERRMWWLRAPAWRHSPRDTRPLTSSIPNANSAPSVPSVPSAPDGWRGAAATSAPYAPYTPAYESGATRAWDATIPASDAGAALVWTGGAQAALAGMAALVAAIVLLNGGAHALAVFAWAMSFALIAGLGAGLAHLAWRARLERQAALALTLSHLGMLVWALALFGPLPALMALLPVTLTLTLRSLGWIATAITATAAGAFYLVTLGLGLVGAWPFQPVTLSPLALGALNGTLIVAGVGLGALALTTLYMAGAPARAGARASARAATLAASELAALRAQTEDDADTLRRALALALRGAQTEPARARGALSPLADQVNITGERLAEFAADREERKRLEATARRLIRNMERAWLGLSWEWPEASGVILDDLVALLRTPPPDSADRLPEQSTPTGQVVAPHLYRGGQPGVSIPSQPLRMQPGLWPDRSAPSQPSGVWPTLWPSDPEPAAPGVDPLALPPAPRFGEPGPFYPTTRAVSDPGSSSAGERDLGDYSANGVNGMNGMNGMNGSASRFSQRPD